MANKYEEIIKRANNTLRWLPGYISEKYSSTDDALYGHMYVRHFERDSGFLKTRCVEERRSASAFFAKGEQGRNAVHEMLLHALLDKFTLEDIAIWLSDPSDPDPIEIEVQNSVPIGHGYTYRNGEAVHRVTKTSIIILGKIAYSNEFSIMTFYPKL